MANRLPRVRERLQDFDADAALLSALPNIRWACGFTGSNGLLLVEKTNAVFVTDGRYTEQARQEVGGAEVVIAENGLLSRLAELDYFDGLRRVVFQADHVTVARFERLKDHLSEITWIPKTGAIADLVASKEQKEVDRIRRAQQVTEAVFDHILGELEPGISERDLAAEITYQHLKRGADKMSFDPIVASGPNGALPHARPTDRTLQNGDLVVIDMGCVREGYASDMTRTVALGSPSGASKEGYEAVKEAQASALKVAKAGMTGKELDAVARNALEDAELSQYFSHGLGHGIGLEVHEWPRVSRTADHDLPEGACVTIEPGVYVPDEGYGVRIEDIVVLREGTCENLIRAPKELLVL